MLFNPTNLRTSIVFINEIHILHFQLKKQNHITFTKLRFLIFFDTAPEAVEIETDVSSMSILEDNMELFK